MSVGILATGALFVLSIGAQVAALSLLPATRGFTHVGLTTACLALFVLGLFSMARLISSGINLSVVVPIMTCTVPVAVVAIAALVLGEPVTPLKVGLLVGGIACIGAAGMTS